MAEGKVSWFNEAKGYGFIAMDNDRDVFVHYSAIQAKGFRTLIKDEPVTFDIVQKPRVHAENVVRINFIIDPKKT